MMLLSRIGEPDGTHRSHHGHFAMPSMPSWSKVMNETSFLAQGIDLGVEVAGSTGKNTAVAVLVPACWDS